MIGSRKAQQALFSRSRSFAERAKQAQQRKIKAMLENERRDGLYFGKPIST